MQAPSIAASVWLPYWAACAVAAAAAETLLTGVILVVYPSLFCELILGTELAASGTALGPIAGIALLGAGMAAWPAPQASHQPARVLRALTAYNGLATIYLAFLALSGAFAGVLLWPAVALHAVLSVLLGWALRAQATIRTRSQSIRGNGHAQ